jgi:CheY-like chemotaxis protein
VEANQSVAVLNASDDVVELLRIVLEDAGFVAVSAHIDEVKRGTVDIQRFVDQHRPCAILYDVSPPYERQWAFMNHLRATPPLSHVPFVITSTNAAKVRELVGTDERVLEIVGKPYDLDAIVDAVQKACGASGRRG